MFFTVTNRAQTSVVFLAVMVQLILNISLKMMQMRVPQRKCEQKRNKFLDDDIIDSHFNVKQSGTKFPVEKCHVALTYHFSDTPCL